MPRWHASLRTPRRTPQVYFLGFAGFGDERVFAEEIALAEQRVADVTTRAAAHCGWSTTGAISRISVGHRGSLRYALEALGGVMDEDDVLFLALSSHGWKDATIAISNPGMRPDDAERRRAGRDRSTTRASAGA